MSENLSIEACGCVFDNVITDSFGNRDLYLSYPNVACKHLKDGVIEHNVAIIKVGVCKSCQNDYDTVEQRPIQRLYLIHNKYWLCGDCANEYTKEDD